MSSGGIVLEHITFGTLSRKQTRSHPPSPRAVCHQELPVYMNVLIKIESMATQALGNRLFPRFQVRQVVTYTSHRHQTQDLPRSKTHPYQRMITSTVPVHTECRAPTMLLPCRTQRVATQRLGNLTNEELASLKHGPAQNQVGSSGPLVGRSGPLAQIPSFATHGLSPRTCTLLASSPILLTLSLALARADTWHPPVQDLLENLTKEVDGTLQSWYDREPPADLHRDLETMYLHQAKLLLTCPYLNFRIRGISQISEVGHIPCTAEGRRRGLGGDWG